MLSGRKCGFTCWSVLKAKSYRLAARTTSHRSTARTVNIASIEVERSNVYMSCTFTAEQGLELYPLMCMETSDAYNESLFVVQCTTSAPGELKVNSGSVLLPRTPVYWDGNKGGYARVPQAFSEAGFTFSAAGLALSATGLRTGLIGLAVSSPTKKKLPACFCSRSIKLLSLLIRGRLQRK
jgi:hypothetical protein